MGVVPGPAPEVRIRLKGEERAQLEAILRKGKTERRLADRARIVLLADEGVYNYEIARRVGHTPETTRTWLKRYAQEGLRGLNDRPRPGRPPAFSPRGTRAGQADRLRAAG